MLRDILHQLGYVDVTGPDGLFGSLVTHGALASSH
jgi:hypothetical protein